MFEGLVDKKMAIAGTNLDGERIPVFKNVEVKRPGFFDIFRWYYISNIDDRAHTLDLSVKIFLDYLLNIQFNESEKVFKT